MTNYYITRISGMDPNAPEPEVRGTCKNTECGEELREDYTYFRDDEDNTFCCAECALEFYGLRETEWPEDDN